MLGHDRRTKLIYMLFNDDAYTKGIDIRLSMPIPTF